MVAVNPGTPDTVTTEPEGTELKKGGPRFAQTIDPSACSAPELFTDWIVCGCASGFVADSATVTPPVGAGQNRVADPVEELPPVKLAGSTDTDASAELLLTVRAAD